MDSGNSLCFQFPASRDRKQETDEGRRKQKWKLRRNHRFSPPSESSLSSYRFRFVFLSRPASIIFFAHLEIVPLETFISSARSAHSVTPSVINCMNTSR